MLWRMGHGQLARFSPIMAGKSWPKALMISPNGLEYSTRVY